MRHHVRLIVILGKEVSAKQIIIEIVTFVILDIFYIKFTCNVELPSLYSRQIPFLQVPI